MKAILFGATGMVGKGVLLECVRDPRVESILEIGRTPSSVTDAKLRKIEHRDFLDFDAIGDELAGYDACFFCLGVSSARMSEADYHRITHDVTIAAAHALLARNPDIVFCFVSGAGTDSTEQGRVMWARVKGKAENHLLALPMRSFMFRPGFIQPAPGVRSRTTLYRVLYAITGPLFPLFRRLFPRLVTTSETISRALVEVAANGYEKRILETPDINAVGGG